MIRVGPAGWSYKDWDGVLYPAAKPKGYQPLALIARLFDLAEVNVTFYSPPRPDAAVRWCQLLDQIGAERFRFAVKLWQGLTHEVSAPDRGEANRLRELLEVLREHDRLVAVLAQFPWSFKNTPTSRQRLANLVETWGQFPLAVEVRHGSWDADEYREWLREHGLTHVNIDQPVIGESLAPSAHLTTSRLAYVRLHGRNAQAWFADNADAAERYNYLYASEELAPWAVRIGQLSERARETVVVTNNHFRAQGVVNALEIQAAADPSRAVTVPASLIEAYPNLRGVPGLREAAPEELPAVVEPREETPTGQLEMF